MSESSEAEIALHSVFFMDKHKRLKLVLYYLWNSLQMIQRSSGGGGGGSLGEEDVGWRGTGGDTRKDKHTDPQHLHKMIVWPDNR